MITHLSDFFKTMLSSGRDVITIQEEKEHILSYLEIQRIRYQDILSYSIDFPPELLQYKILKLTLQPLVENSLYHGIKEKRGKGFIAIKAEIKEDCILFTVSDNGRGMSKEELEKLKVDIQIKPEDQKKSFGLYNVQQRLVLKYGIGYGINFESILNEGTIATVKIPINK